MGKIKNILVSALDCARDLDYRKMTRADVARYAGTSEALVSYHLGDMTKVRQLVMELALNVEDVHVLAQGLFYKDPIALDAPKELKVQAIRTICIEGGLDVQ